MTTTGDFSAKAPATEFTTFRPADAIGDAHHAQAVQARIAIGGETRALLIAGGDDFEVGLQHLIVKPEDVIAGNAEDMPHAVRPQPLDQVFADRNSGVHGR